MDPVIILSLGRPTSGTIWGPRAEATSDAPEPVSGQRTVEAASGEAPRIHGTPADIERQLLEAVRAFSGRAKSGDPAARAARELLPRGAEPLLGPIAAELAARAADAIAGGSSSEAGGAEAADTQAGGTKASSTKASSTKALGATPPGEPALVSNIAPYLAPLAYEHADSLIGAGRVREAAALLSAVVSLPGAEFDGLLGLTVCALQLQRPEVALALAHECLKRDPRHPRACCLAAHCELKRGDRRAAQNYYALATRLARSRPEFRDDLRAAQRALLLMHLT